MTILDGSEQASDEAQDQQTEDQQVVDEAPEGGTRPGWEGIQSKLDPVSFAMIKDDLADWDQNAKQRIESQNQKYSPWKQFDDQGITPDLVQQSVALVQKVQNDPVEVFTTLRDFLAKEGRLPTEQELQEELDEDGEGDDESKPVQINDPRLDQAMEFIQAQQQKTIEDAANQQLTTEIAQLKEDHKDYDQKDVDNVIRLASAGSWANHAQGINRPFTVAEAAAQYEDMRQQILSTPRAGSTAPKLTPTSGGLPSREDGKKVTELNKQETQALITDFLQKAESN